MHGTNSAACSTTSATSNQDVVPDLRRGYRVGEWSKEAPFVMSHSEIQNGTDRKRDRGWRKDQYWSRERGSQNCINNKRSILDRMRKIDFGVKQEKEKKKEKSWWGWCGRDWGKM